MGQCQTKVAPIVHEDASTQVGRPERYAPARKHHNGSRPTISAAPRGHHSSSSSTMWSKKDQESFRRARRDSVATFNGDAVPDSGTPSDTLPLDDSPPESPLHGEDCVHETFASQEDKSHMNPLIRRLDEQTFAVDKYTTIFNTSPDCLVVADTSGTILECNPSFLETFRYSQAEIIGKPLSTIIPVRLRELHDQGFRRFLSTGVAKLVGSRNAAEVPALRKDGTEFPVELTIASVMRAGQQVLCGFLRDITARKEAEAAQAQASRSAQQGSEMYSAVLTNSPDSIIIIDPDSTIVDCNASFLETFEYSREEVVGNHIHMIIPSQYREMHDAGVKRYLETRKPRLVGVRAGVEITALRKGNREFPVSLTLSVVHRSGQLPVFCGFIRDITARKDAEAAKVAALEKAHQQSMLFSAIVEHTPDSIVMIDKDGVIISCNPSFCDTLGYSSQSELLDRNITVIIPPRFHSAHNAGMRRYLDTGVPHLVGLRQGVEVAAIKKDGSEFPVELSLSTTEHDGRRVFCGFLRDISARKEAERQRLLAVEAEKSELLLQNMLPAVIAQRLKQGEFPIADSFSEVSVLFLDICGFTGMSSTLTPDRLVVVLNRFFTACDDMLNKYPSLEKIKSIGDALLISCGCPNPCENHAQTIADFALDLIALCCGELAAMFQAEVHSALAVRIGIHCGPVTAGVIGQKKFLYDVFGDTVNAASRMESSSKPNRICVSDEFHTALEKSCPGRYVFEARQEINIKGKGMMKTWFINGRGYEVQIAAGNSLSIPRSLYGRSSSVTSDMGDMDVQSTDNFLVAELVE